MLLVSSLEPGGAERQVVQLARNLDRKRFDPVVCSLSESVPLADELRDRESELVVVEKRWRYDATPVWRVARVMRDRGVSIVHAFLFDAEMVARLAARLAGVPVVIGSERNTDYRRTMVQSLCQRLTRGMFDGLIANSQSGRRFAMRTLGIAGDRIHVVRNGVNLEQFRPLDGSCARQQLGIEADEVVVGMVGSFKPQKNHLMFLQVARRVVERLPRSRFLFVGGRLNEGGEKLPSLRPGTGFHRNVAAYHRQVSETIDELGLRERCLLVGKVGNMAEMYSACDVTVLTSHHEGTPNVLLESMACGVPVVATNVSDNAFVVPDGEVGYLVEPDNVAGMVERVCGLLGDRAVRRRMGVAGRKWVEKEFSTAILARNTEAVYLELLEKKRQRWASGGMTVPGRTGGS